MLQNTRILLRRITSNSSRLFSTTRAHKNIYQDAEKTTVRILNTEAGYGVMIDAYSEIGFRLNNGILCVGPIVVFPRTILCWNVSGDDDITVDSLGLFTLIEPKIETLIVGYGETSVQKSNFDKVFLEMRKKRQMNIEFLKTPNAVAMYNFLASDDRQVAAALIPPKIVSFSDDDVARAKFRKKSLYSDEEDSK